MTRAGAWWHGIRHGHVRWLYARLYRVFLFRSRVVVSGHSVFDVLKFKILDTLIQVNFMFDISNLYL